MLIRCGWPHTQLTTVRTMGIYDEVFAALHQAAVRYVDLQDIAALSALLEDRGRS